LGELTAILWVEVYWYYHDGTEIEMGFMSWLEWVEPWGLFLENAVVQSTEMTIYGA